MLQDIKTLPDEMERFDYWFRGIVAVDLEIKAHLQMSNGRRKLGRPSRYYVSAPNGEYYTGYFQRSVSPENPKGEEQVPRYRTVCTLSAFTDQEAIDKANKMLPKKYAQFKAALEVLAQ